LRHVSIETPQKKEELGLARYDAMCQAIIACRRVDEVKNIHDKARALEVYAVQVKNKEMQLLAGDIRTRAAYHGGKLLGEMLKAGERHKGATATVGPGRGKKQSRPSTALPTIADLGLTKTQASYWTTLAKMGEAEFEDYLAKHCTIERLVRQQRAKEKQRKQKRAQQTISDEARKAFSSVCDIRHCSMKELLTSAGGRYPCPGGVPGGRASRPDEAGRGTGRWEKRR
jgi:hypothetical protein